MTAMTTPHLPRRDRRVRHDPGFIRYRSLAARAIRNVAVLVILALWLLPTIGLLVTSFRPAFDASLTGWWTILSNPTVTLDNYRAVLAGGSGSAAGFGRAFLNSIAIAVPSTVIPITVAVFAGYGFSWLDFRGREALFLGVIALMIMPVHMALVPLLSATASGVSLFGVTVLPPLRSPLVGVWLVHTAYGLPLATFLMRNYIAALPHELIDAARVDGASDLGVFLRIVLPLSVPAIASFAIFQFLWVFNDYLVPVVFVGLNPEVAPVTVKLADLVGSRGQDQHLLSAGAFVSMALPLLVFFSLQRYFVRGLTAGAVKG